MINSNEGAKEVFTALAAVNAELVNPERNRTVTVTMKSGGTYEFSYATLDTILDQVRPLLARNGLSLLQAVGDSAHGTATLLTRLAHSSGGFLETSYPIHAEGAGPQDFAKAVTYARRNALTALLSIFAEEDEDGNAAQGNAITASRTKGEDRKKVDTSEADEEDRARGWGYFAGGPACIAHGVAMLHKTGVSKGSGKPYSFYACPVKEGGDFCRATCKDEEKDRAASKVAARTCPPPEVIRELPGPCPPPDHKTESKVADFLILIDEAQSAEDLKRVAALAAKQSKAVRDALRGPYEARLAAIKAAKAAEDAEAVTVGDANG